MLLTGYVINPQGLRSAVLLLRVKQLLKHLVADQLT